MQITEVELVSHSVWLLLQDGGQVGKPRGTAECQYFQKDFTKRATLWRRLRENHLRMS